MQEMPTCCACKLQTGFNYACINRARHDACAATVVMKHPCKASRLCVLSLSLSCYRGCCDYLFSLLGSRDSVLQVTLESSTTLLQIRDILLPLLLDILHAMPRDSESNHVRQTLSNVEDCSNGALMAPVSTSMKPRTTDSKATLCFAYDEAAIKRPCLSSTHILMHCCVVLCCVCLSVRRRLYLPSLFGWQQKLHHAVESRTTSTVFCTSATSCFLCCSSACK